MTITDPDIEAQLAEQFAASASSAEIAELRDEVRRQGRTIRASQNAFSIFALLALLLAAGTLLAVAFKIDKTTTKTTTVTNAAAPAAAAPAAAATPALGHAVGVNLSEFKIVPNAAAAAAGKVTFSLHNIRNVKHEFVVLKTDKPAGSLLKGAEADETGNVGEVGNLPAGSSKKLTLNLKAGHYALICNLPGHYKSGQHADFTVR